MSIVKRVTAFIASGLALAATPEANTWKTPRPISPLMPEPPATGVPPLSPQPPQPSRQAEASALPPPVGAPRSRELVVFALGFALAAAVAAGLWLQSGTGSWSLSAKLKPGVTPPPSAARVSGQLATCAMEPAAPAASEKDGRFPLQAGVAGLIAADIASFIVIGNDAASAGRPRDAEAAFLMSCRVADKLKGAGSVESADAKYQLGAHYAGLALDSASVAGPQRAELLGRAEQLYADSSQTYLASYGQSHEKSQLAANGLATVRQAMLPTPTPAPVLAQDPAQPPALPAPAAKLSNRIEGSETPPRAAPAGPGAAPAVSPSPPAVAEGKARQRPPLIQECLPAVAALGLCDPGT